jgi:hypothetical protein
MELHNQTTPEEESFLKDIQGVFQMRFSSPTPAQYRKRFHLFVERLMRTVRYSDEMAVKSSAPRAQEVSEARMVSEASKTCASWLPFTTIRSMRS